MDNEILKRKDLKIFSLEFKKKLIILSNLIIKENLYSDIARYFYYEAKVCSLNIYDNRYCTYHAPNILAIQSAAGYNNVGTAVDFCRLLYISFALLTDILA
jgi:hypothetical protein